MNSLKNTLRIIIITIFILIITKLSSQAATSTATVSTDTLKMRKEASTSSEIVTLLSEGFEIQIIEKQGDWYKVKYNNYTGYVHGDYIKVKQSQTQTSSQGNTTNKTTNSNTNTSNNTNTTSTNTVTQSQNTVNTTNTTTQIPETTQPVDNKIDESSNIQLQANMYAKLKSNQGIYIVPLISSSIIETVKKDEKVYILQVVNEWCYVSAENANGWIRIDKLSDITVSQEENAVENTGVNNTQEQNTNTQNNTTSTPQTTTTNPNTVSDKKIGYINSESVNFRKKADKASDVIDVLEINTQVNILSEEKGWYKVEVNGVQGYVAPALVSDEKTPVTSSRSMAGPREQGEDTNSNQNIGNAKKAKQQEIVKFAKSFLGAKYVYGGSSPKGFDCSGFVQYVYKHFGYSVSRSSSAQAKDGVAVDKANLEPGDIVIFKAYNDYSRIGHVGIYIGENSFIHADDESTGVIITSLSKGKYPQRFITGRRII